jgi:hypothetical protein
MVGSWALVEVPRYLYLAVNTICKSMRVQPPLLLHLLRYNLFMLLYPSGISGEYLQVPPPPHPHLLTAAASNHHPQMLNALPSLHASKSFGLWYYTVALLLLYIPMGPFMIMNMNGQRIKANKNRAEALLLSPKLESGILFPRDRKASNTRPTSAAGQNAFAATFTAIGDEPKAKSCSKGTWRYEYNGHLLEHVKSSLESKDNAVTMARAGIDFIYRNFEFGGRNADGELQPPVPLLQALKSTAQVFTTHVVQGTQKELPKKVTVPYAKYPNKNQTLLEGEQLKEKLQQWAQRGTIEPDTAKSLMWAVDNQATIDLRNHWFVLLGAGAAMGPLPILLAHGANVVAVDVKNFQVNGQTRSPWWQASGNGILNRAQNSPGACCATPIFPYVFS